MSNQVSKVKVQLTISAEGNQGKAIIKQHLSKVRKLTSCSNLIPFLLNKMDNNQRLKKDIKEMYLSIH